MWGGEWIQARSLSTFRTDTAVRLCRRSRSLYVCVSVCVCSGPVAGPVSGAAFDARFVCDVTRVRPEALGAGAYLHCHSCLDWCTAQHEQTLKTKSE